MCTTVRHWKPVNRSVIKGSFTYNSNKDYEQMGHPKNSSKIAKRQDY